MIAVAIALNFTIVSKVKSVKRTFVGTCVISTWLVCGSSELCEFIFGIFLVTFQLLGLLHHYLSLCTYI